jgi:hypothetical protein
VGVKSWLGFDAGETIPASTKGRQKHPFHQLRPNTLLGAAGSIHAYKRKSILKSPYPPFSKWGTEGMEPTDFVNE